MSLVVFNSLYKLNEIKMILTQVQKAALKTHIAANTNTITAIEGTVQIKNIVDNGDNYQFVANWYNGLALAGDDQPFSNPLSVWRPVVTIQQLNSAVVWSANPAGGDAASITNGWLKWQSMCWSNQIDMTDAQVRQGIDDVWGSGSASATAIKANNVGRQVATRAEMLFAGAAAGAARVCGLDGSAVPKTTFGQKLTGSDILDAILNG